MDGRQHFQYHKGFLVGRFRSELHLSRADGIPPPTRNFEIHSRSDIPQEQGRTSLSFKEKCAMSTAIPNTAKAFLEHDHPRLAFGAVIMMSLGPIIRLAGMAWIAALISKLLSK
jgi:hypothetical protein